MELNFIYFFWSKTKIKYFNFWLFLVVQIESACAAFIPYVFLVRVNHLQNLPHCYALNVECGFEIRVANIIRNNYLTFDTVANNRESQNLNRTVSRAVCLM